MPIPHHDYDIDFKPAIARYDWDQTYDVLEFVHLPQGFNGLMDSLGIPAFELMAIDRYTPYSYLWAEQYSDAVYNFLKQFNFSPHCAIHQRFLNSLYGNRIRDENNNSITIPAFVFSGEKYSKTAEYKVTLTEGKYEITGLVYQGWTDGIIDSIPTINQTSYRFILSETTEVNLNRIINHWCKDSLTGDSQFCVNSLVLSRLNGSQWTEVTVDAPSFLFYSDIADYWGQVSGALLQYFDVPFEGIHYPLQHTMGNISLIYNIDIDYSLNSDYSKYNNYTAFPVTKEKTITYTKIPDFFLNQCYLCRANNNRWGGATLNDLGYLLLETHRRLNNNILNSITGNYYLFNNITEVTLITGEYIIDITDNNSFYKHPYLSLANPFLFSPQVTKFFNTSHEYHFRQNYFSTSLFDTGAMNPGWVYGGLDRGLWGSNERDFNLRYVPSIISMLPRATYGYNYHYSYPFCKYRKITIEYPQHLWAIEQEVIGTAGTYVANHEGEIRDLLVRKSEYHCQKWETIFYIGFNNYLPSDVPFKSYLETEWELGFITDQWVFASWVSNNEYGRIDEVDTRHVETYSPDLPKDANGRILLEYDLDYSYNIDYEFFTQEEWEELYNYNAVSDEEYLAYLQTTKAQLEGFMVDSVRIKEIHACLGAGELAYYNNNGTPTPYVMHIARNLDYLVKAFGLYYNPNGTLMSITTDVSIPPPNNNP